MERLTEMEVRHTTALEAFCPVNGARDSYLVDAYPTKLLYAEQVLEARDRLKDLRATQEDLTQDLANELDCKVRTVGTHCQGKVQTVVACYPNGEARKVIP